MIKRLKSCRTIETEYFGILAVISGGLVTLLWYYWIGSELKKEKEMVIGNYALFLVAGIIGYLGISYLLQVIVTNLRLYPFLESFIILLGIFSTIGYFSWNLWFRKIWNEEIKENKKFKCSFFWTFLLGPIYLNFKINQIKGKEQ